MPPLVQAIIGTTRPDRFSEKPVAWLVDRIGRRDDIELEVLDLRDHPLPLFEEKLPLARSLRNYPNENMARIGRLVDRADGYIIVTGEYNHGYPAALKNALDHLFPEFNRKPVAFVGYGNVGGARAIEQLRQVVVELEMAPLRHAVHIPPQVMIEAINVGEFSPELFASLDERLELLVADLAWWASALRDARNNPVSDT
jgi:NAD(P)H-dependent FMN reductase